MPQLSTSASARTCPRVNSLIKCAYRKLNTFEPTSSDEISTIVMKASRATCSLDPVPPGVLIDVLPRILPVLVHIVNLSLFSGFFPDSFKSAIVKPLLKKSTLNPDCFKNYRPESNLSFLSKVIEKVLAVRLFDHTRNNDLLEPM